MDLTLLAAPARLWHRAPKSSMAVLAVVCVLFGALLVIGIYYVKVIAGASPPPRFAVGAVQSSSKLDAGDPVSRFAETGVGHVLFAPRVGDHCQRILFDNRTGVQYETASIDCARQARQPVTAGSRVGEMGKTFQK